MWGAPSPRTAHPALPVSRLGKGPLFTRPACRTYLLGAGSAKIWEEKVRDGALAVAKPQRPSCSEKPEVGMLQLLRLVSPRNL